VCGKPAQSLIAMCLTTEIVLHYIHPQIENICNIYSSIVFGIVYTSNTLNNLSKLGDLIEGSKLEHFVCRKRICCTPLQKPSQI